MVTVIWAVPLQDWHLKHWISTVSPINMVNVASFNMGGFLDHLREVQLCQSSGDAIATVRFGTQVEISSDEGWSAWSDPLLNCLEDLRDAGRA